MANVNFCVLDLETTGLGKAAKICEIAIMAFDENGHIIKRYEQRINPGCSIPAQASAIHGIYDRDVAQSPRFEDVADQIIEALNWALPAEDDETQDVNIWDARPTKKPLIGHNILAYDLPILRAHFDIAGKVMPSVNAVDTLKMARERWPKHPDGNKLIVCCARMGIEEPNDIHGASADVEINGKLYHRMMSGESYEPTQASVKAKAEAAEVLDILAGFDFSSF